MQSDQKGRVGSVHLNLAGSLLRRIVLVLTLVMVALLSLVVLVDPARAQEAAGAAPRATTAPAPASAPRTVTVRAGEDGSLTMPSTLRPGRYRFVVTGDSCACVQAAKVLRSYGKERFFSDVVGSSAAAAQRVSTRVRFVGGTNSGPGRSAVFYATLSSGRYWFYTPFAADSPGLVRTVTVAGTVRSSSAPSVAATITSTGGALSGSAAAPLRGNLLVRNRGTAARQVVLVQLARGRTLADARRWLNDPEPDGASPLTEVQTATAVIGPRAQMVWGYDLPAGTYVAISYLPYGGETPFAGARLTTLRLG
ncbi:MAG: hypothetical protein M3P96_11325 [Actinomycetota bacterium]|nr:hypothetical protein [Actinomycetota bacterium]